MSEGYIKNLKYFDRKNFRQAHLSGQYVSFFAQGWFCRLRGHGLGIHDVLKGPFF